MHTIVLGLGTNIGNCVENLQHAVDELAKSALGRRPNVRWEPRLIDILFYDDLILHKEKLNIPHARIPERAFVLVPFAEIAPRWNHPEINQTVAEMETAVSKDGVQKLASKITLRQPISD